MKIAKSRAQVSSQTTLSRARSPHGAPTAGVGAYFTGANILTDPGFEGFVDNSGGWHWPSRAQSLETYVIPKFDITCPSYMTWPDGTCVAANNTLVSWFQGAGSFTSDGDRDDQAWKVSVHDPQAGDYHAIYWWWDASGFPPPELCAFSPFIGAPFSCRVNPGDDITWSAYSKVFATTGTPQVSMVLRFYNQSFGLIAASQSSFANLTTSYAQYSHTATAPSGSYYLRACLSFLGGTGNEWPVYVDTAVLGVQ